MGVYKNLFIILIIYPAYFLMLFFVGLYLPFIIITKIYNFVIDKVHENSKADNSGCITFLTILFVFEIFYITGIFLLSKLFTPLENWSVIPIFIISIVVYLVIKTAEK